ncbi:MAG: MotA/TolQ/ExbB proton channel family protein [bacterium]|nr:MotA/TolQ/ExbB proton channel family protein [bacterium]
MLQLMGPLALPLLLCSSLVLAILAERSWFFLASAPTAERLAERFTQLRPQEAKDPGPVGEALANLLLTQAEAQLTRFLPWLRILAAISPLLGLLGTVFGMMEAFETIAGQDRPITPALVAEGISHALTTTAAGLIIAIPALLGHSLFALKAQNRLKTATEALTLSHHGLEVTL